jgi:hypothetical protein
VYSATGTVALTNPYRGLEGPRFCGCQQTRPVHPELITESRHMPHHDFVSSLSRDARLGFLGDSHGDLKFVIAASETMKGHGVDTLVVLGDFGFLWNSSEREPTQLSTLSAHLLAQEQTLFFVDGNHENFDLLHALPIGVDGTRQVAPAITHLPRGYRTTLASGLTLAALGGANSIDFRHRRKGISWWSEESITDADLADLGTEHADVMIGHDAPLSVPALEARLLTTARYWSAEGLAYAGEGQRKFHQGFLQVRPELYLGGHYHFKVDNQVRYGTGDAEFETRVIVLDSAEGPAGDSVAILDVHTLEIEYPTS